MKRIHTIVIFSVFLVIAACSTVKKTGTAEDQQNSGSQNTENTILVNGNGEIADFYLGKYEVTQEEFEKVMGHNPSHFKGAKLPVENLTWLEALEYCNRLSQQLGLEPYYNLSTQPVSIHENSNGYRLPTRDEWRFAARGGNHSADFVYSGSNNRNEVAWYKENGENKTHPVGRKKANELGFFDMSGNVYEYTYSTGRHIPILGGCFGDNEDYLRPQNSNFYGPTDKSEYTGFRIARSAKL